MPSAPAEGPGLQADVGVHDSQGMISIGAGGALVHHYGTDISDAGVLWSATCAAGRCLKTPPKDQALLVS